MGKEENEEKKGSVLEKQKGEKRKKGKGEH